MLYESWEPCIDGRYLVSNLGRLRNAKTDRMRKPQKHSQGYDIITYWCKTDKKYTTKLIHRLVCAAFIPNPHNKKFVNHLDGDKTNNRVDNLQWCTRQENEDHAFRTGLKISKGSRNPCAKLTEMDVREIKQSPLSTHQLAEEYGVHRATIQRIINGKIWTHVIAE